MEYTTRLLSIEISRMEKRIEDDQAYLDSSIARTAFLQETINHNKEILAELVYVLNTVNSTDHWSNHRDPGS